jgi:hypothetical protein
MNEQGRNDGVKGTYEVWHDIDAPHSTIAAMIDGELPRFPEVFAHVASVHAESLQQAVELTNHKMDLNEPASKWVSWQKNPGVEALVEIPRSTMLGDVIVDPRGHAHRVERAGFKEIAAHDQSVEPRDRHLEGATNRDIVHQPDIELEQ